MAKIYNFLSFKRTLKQRVSKHDHELMPVEFANGKFGFTVTVLKNAIPENISLEFTIDETHFPVITLEASFLGQVYTYTDDTLNDLGMQRSLEALSNQKSVIFQLYDRCGKPLGHCNMNNRHRRIAKDMLLKAEGYLR